jgi:ParB family transcriptional regulator, chromosome partitioning protein
MLLSIDTIVANPLQPRRHFDAAALDELAASIKEHGILQPLIVTRTPQGTYSIVVGERRWRAARRAGLTQVPVIVREFAQAEWLEVALIENIQRADLNPLEEAAAYSFLMREYGLKQDQVAVRVGKSRSAIANTLRLLHLPPEIQKDIADGVLSAGHARALLSIDNPALLRKVWERTRTAHLSVRQVEDLVRRELARLKQEQGEEAPRKRTAWTDVEETLQEKLSAQVRIKPKGTSSGCIEIRYGSSEDLDRVIDYLMGHRVFRRVTWGDDLL